MAKVIFPQDIVYAHKSERLIATIQLMLYEMGTPQVTISIHNKCQRFNGLIDADVNRRCGADGG